MLNDVAMFGKSQTDYNECIGQVHLWAVALLFMAVVSGSYRSATLSLPLPSSCGIMPSKQTKEIDALLSKQKGLGARLQASIARSKQFS